VANLWWNVGVVQRFGEIGEMKALAVLGQRIGEVGIGIAVVRVIISEAGFAPATEVKVQIRADARTAALAIIQMKHSVKLRIEEPVIAGQDERAIAAAVAGNEIEVVRPGGEVA